MATRRQAKAMLRIWADRLLAHKNVVAVAIGRKNGDPAERGWCIRVHVTRKTARRTSHSVPRLLRSRRGARMMPVKTDVIATGLARPQFDIRASFGLRVSHHGQFGNGVIGCVVRAVDGAIYALTSAHILGNKYVVSPEYSGRLADTSRFPAKLLDDEGRPKTEFGKCCFTSFPGDPIDVAAIEVIQGEARPISAIRGTRTTVPTAKETLTILRRPNRGPYQTVYVAGADHDGIARVAYGNQVRLMAPVIFYPRCDPERNEFRPSLEVGDSGSAVVDLEGRLIGMHFAATDRALDGDTIALGYAVPWTQIRRWLLCWTSGVEILTDSGFAPS